MNVVFDSQKWRPTHIVLCFVLFFLRLVYPILPVSLYFQFSIAPSVLSNVQLYLCTDRLMSYT